MTVDDAAALARQIARVLKNADASFLLAIEYDVDDERTRAVWHVGGNNTGIANMAAVMLDGVVRAAEPSDCEACNAAIAAMQGALASLVPAGADARTCH